MKAHSIDILAQEIIKRNLDTTPYDQRELEEIYEVFGFDHFGKGLDFLRKHAISIGLLKEYMLEVESCHDDLPENWNTIHKSIAYFPAVLKKVEERCFGKSNYTKDLYEAKTIYLGS
ncbi:hypothetical protein [Belliella pelovolcani]|uniref:hypothetical protein n=1 Tax=Belliella pelovolcani TaxID=529505 RepID=UPI00391CCB3D